MELAAPCWLLAVAFEAQFEVAEAVVVPVVDEGEEVVDHQLLSQDLLRHCSLVLGLSADHPY